MRSGESGRKPLIDGVFKDTTGAGAGASGARAYTRSKCAGRTGALQPFIGGGYSTALAKSQKVCRGRANRTPPYQGLGRFRNGGRHRKMGWVYNPPTHLNQMFTFVEKPISMKKISMSNGLDVRNGRLINNRPDGMTGIQQMCEIKKMQKREQKIEMMVEADVRASMREKMMGYES